MQPAGTGCLIAAFYVATGLQTLDVGMTDGDYMIPLRIHWGCRRSLRFQALRLMTEQWQPAFAFSRCAWLTL